MKLTNNLEMHLVYSKGISNKEKQLDMNDNIKWVKRPRPIDVGKVNAERHIAGKTYPVCYRIRRTGPLWIDRSFVLMIF